MTHFLLIFICISAGIILSRLHAVPADTYKGVNTWIIYVALPALILRYISGIEWGRNILLPVIGPLLVWAGAWVFVKICNAKKRLSAGSQTALLVTCGLGNTAFLGFPMVSAYYGESEIQHAVVFDQITFILFSTVGVLSILRVSSEKSEPLNFFQIVKKMLTFPPALGCMVAVTLTFLIDCTPAYPLLDKLVATLSPMALFSIGLQLKFGAIRETWKLISAGLVYKLLLAPALVLLLAFLLQTTGNPAKISVFEAGMSSHMTVSLLAGQHGLNPKYCSLIVGMGIVTGFITSTCWYIVLNYLF